MTPQTQPVPTGAMAAEPAVTVTTITTLVSAVFAGIVLAVPGIDPTWEQIIIGIIVAAWPIVTATMIRQRVPSPQTAQTAANQAALTGTAPDVMTGAVTGAPLDRDPDKWPDPPPPEPIRVTRRDGSGV
jgi:cytochrome c biogenesis protein CcdA